MARKVEPSMGRPVDQRPWLMLAGGLLFLLTAMVLTGAEARFFFRRIFAELPCFLFWLASAAGFGMMGRKMNRDSLWWATAIAMGLGILSVITLLLGLSAMLNRATAFATLGLGATLFLVSLSRTKPKFSQLAPTSTATSWLWLFAISPAAVMLVSTAIMPGLLWFPHFPDPNGYDVLVYHLQVPREWFEAGRITPLEHNAYSFFPFNVEMHYLLAMHLRGGPWDGMYLAQIIHATYFVVTALAAHGYARRVSESKVVPALAALAVIATPWTLLLAPIAYNEGGLLLYGTLAAAWTMLALRNDENRSKHFALAGAFAGFACGSKLTGVPIYLIACPVIALILLALKTKNLRVVTGPAIYLAAGILTFAPWMIRNQVWTGNPVFPEAAHLLGTGHFTEAQVERWETAHGVPDAERPIGKRLGAAVNSIVLDWRYGFALIPIGVVLGVIGFRRDEVRLALLLIVSLVLFWLLFTHLQARFLVGAVGLVALLVGSIRLRLAMVVIAVFIAAMCIGGTFQVGAVARGLALDGAMRLPPDWPMRNYIIPEPSQGEIDAARTLHLVGDARAFWYPYPMTKLRYRTVLDVRSTVDQDAILAWLNGSLPRDPQEVILVDPAEMERLRNTYKGIPALPSQLREQHQPFIIDTSP